MNTSKKIQLTLVIIALIVVGVLIWNRKKQSQVVANINSYEDCVAAGYPIMEIYPEQCKTPDNRTFTRQISATDDWQEQTIEEIGLTLRYPANLIYRQEIADNAGTIRAVGFYLENNDPNKPYTLYGLYQADRPATIDDLERAKTEMDTATIKPVEVDGFSGIEGLIEGEKTRYITTLLVGDKLFSVSTIPPTQENKTITDNILATFAFNNDN